MVDPTSFSSPEEYAAARDELFKRIGHSTAAATVTMLRTHWHCDCLGCQMDVAIHQIKWALSGEPIEEGRKTLDLTIQDLLAIRRDIKRQQAFNALAERYGINPDTIVGQA